MIRSIIARIAAYWVEICALAIFVVLGVSVYQAAHAGTVPKATNVAFVVMCGEPLGALIAYDDGSLELRDDIGSPEFMKLANAAGKEHIGALTIKPACGCPKPDRETKNE